MTHEFKVGDEVLVRGQLVSDIEQHMFKHIKLRSYKELFYLNMANIDIKPIETPFLIEGRTYQCRREGLTATVSKNERGWWIALYSDNVKAQVSEIGFYFEKSDSLRDLISLLPEPVICKCCGQVMKEKE